MRMRREWTATIRNAIVLAALISFVGALRLYAQQFSPSLYREMRWRCIGPFRGGRTVAASGVPSEPNVFYMAANDGGVWKTTDYGRTWDPIFDGQPTGSVGALAVAPSNPNVIYVGSGEGLQRPDLSTGDGIYKSTDAGKTWNHLGLRDGQQIASIMIDPRDPNRVFVAVLGHPYGPNTERGVFRSTDGGATWKKILYKDENTGAVDLAFDPANSSTIYAALWAARRTPWEAGLRGRTNGLFKSTDGGNTWKPLTKGLPTNDEGLGRIGIGIAPGDGNRIYALVDAGRLGGLYRSDDAGASWQRVNNEQRVWGRGDDFAWVRVAPNNKDEVYVCNTSTYRSEDAGKTFTAIKGAPGGDDYHAIWINPRNPRILLLAADQGATISVNGGKTWSSWYNQPTAQFFHVITDNQFPYWVYGGQQESGSAGTASRSDWGEITFRDWHPVGAEEYGYIAPDPLHPNLIYGGKVTRFDSITGQTQDVAPFALRSGKYHSVRTAPLIFSPADPRILYLGENVLFKTTDGGHSWQVISPDLSRENPGVPANLTSLSVDNPARGEHRGEIYSLAPSALDANLIWAGTDDGLIWVTRDGGAHWDNVTPPEMTAWSKVAQLDASRFDRNTAYAAVNRFRLDDLRPYIYRTHDGGKTWQKITNGLPDNASVNVVREDPVRRGLLFAGTERAVYVSFNDGDSWQSLQLNLPATSMRDLVIHGDDLVVGTHGRSFWILDDITPLRQITEQVASADAFLFKPETAYRLRRDVNTDTPLPPETPAGQNPPDGAIIDYHLKAAASSPVKLEISDTSGRVVRNFSSADKPEVTWDELGRTLNVPLYWVQPPRILGARPGMNRFVWDLRLAPPKSLSHEYPISAIPHDTPGGPLGALVLPGAYTVKLTVGSQTYTQPLEVKMDPRVKASASDLAEQFKLASQLCAGMNFSYGALQEVRDVRAQLKALSARAPKGAVATAIASLDAREAEFEGAGGRRFGPQAQQGQQESFSRINGELGQLLSAVDGADAEPTESQAAGVADVTHALGTLATDWKTVTVRDVPALNQLLDGAKLPEIKLGPEIKPPAGMGEAGGI
ncbi:MAG TPA: hypothetical protein VN661_03120 [Candidatus Acidoferrales bacterium]|nr:hypothetical protein [Candidatus Acidoferrales bacterium]